MTNKAGGCHRTLSIFSLIVAVFAVAAWAGLQHPLAQRFFMRFFRDVSRARSYARLHASSTALALAFGGDDEERLRFQLRAPGNGGSLSSAADPSLHWAADTGVRMTAEELQHFNGEGGRPLYLAVHGRIFDVSANPSLYGPGMKYHFLVGRDATRALATGCRQPACLVPSLLGLKEQEKLEAMRWVDFFERHDRYHFVGHLVPDFMADVIQRSLLEEQAQTIMASIIDNHQNHLDSAIAQMGDYAEQQFAEDQHDLALAMWTVAMDTAKEHAAPFSPAIAKKVAEHILLPRAAAHLHHQQYSRARDDYRAVVTLLDVASATSTDDDAMWLTAKAYAGMVRLSNGEDAASTPSPTYHADKAISLYQSLYTRTPAADADRRQRLKTDLIAVLVVWLRRRCEAPAKQFAKYDQLLQDLCQADPVPLCKSKLTDNQCG